MPWWGYVLVALLIGVLPVTLFMVYCFTSDSQRKSSFVINSIIRYIFYIVLVLICIYGFGSALHSCASEPYESGYADGYEAGIEEGINRVKDDPGAYFD